jgi:galactose mutarotase-like enzyme
MTTVTIEPRQTDPIIHLRSDILAITITPGKGGDITSIRHLPTDQETLWQTPWGGRPGGYMLPGSDTTEAWLQGYSGGWQLLLPNGGDACEHDGVRHAFHGEAALAPWEWTTDGDGVQLRLAFFTLPLVMRRSLSLDGDLLTIEEELTNDGAGPVELVWGHHPGFGGALLAGPARLTCGARRVTVDDRPDARGNALLPGSESAWPLARSADGREIDLRTPLEGRHGMAYLGDFAGGWAALTRVDGAIGVALSWDAALFPTAWLWQELGASEGSPWFGRARVVGIEPCTSWPGHGLAQIAARTGTQLRLAPGERRATTLRLHVFTGLGEVIGTREGRALGTPAP